MKSKFYLPELDGLRFFAFLLVFIHHSTYMSFSKYFSFLYQVGWIGVDLFFVLSAYLFTKLLQLEIENYKKIDIFKFYLRRIFRIWPTYFILVLFCYFFLSKELSNSFDLFGLITFSDNFFSIYRNQYNSIPGTPHLWTISYEEQFYIIVPFLIGFLCKNANKLKYLLLIYLLLCFIKFVTVFNGINFLSRWTLVFTHFESILFGVFFAVANINTNKFSKYGKLFLILGLALFIPISKLFNNPEMSYWIFAKDFLIGLSTLLIFISVIYDSFLKMVFSFPVFVYLGKRSYGLYLYHMIGNIFGKYVIVAFKIVDNGILIQMIISFFSTIFISIISYKFIEIPFLKIKKRFEKIESRPI